MIRERSRSRDTGGQPWDIRHPTWPPYQHRNLHVPQAPTPSQERRVLLVIDLDQTRELLTEMEHDAMDMTTCDFVDNLYADEQRALFTYARLLSPRQIRNISVEDLLYRIGEYIFNTWGACISPDSMDLRWSDITGDTFALRNHETISSLLAEHRPHWQQAQETGIFHRLVPFSRPNCPYIMRVSCHKALPNPNFLP